MKICLRTPPQSYVPLLPYCLLEVFLGEAGVVRFEDVMYGARVIFEGVLCAHDPAFPHSQTTLALD